MVESDAGNRGELEALEGGEEILAAKLRLLMQLRRSVTDSHLLAVMENIPREQFVPRMFQSKAYDDVALPIELGQSISQPSMVALMTDALQVNDRHRVLEIGTGSGYQSAVLAKLCRRVYSVERHRELLEEAQKRLEGLGIGNVTTICADGYYGWKDKEAAPFDRIMVTASAKEMPEPLIEQLKVGGIMVVPVGAAMGKQELLRVERTAEGYQTKSLMVVDFVPLIKGNLPKEE